MVEYSVVPWRLTISVMASRHTVGRCTVRAGEMQHGKQQVFTKGLLRTTMLARSMGSIGRRLCCWQCHTRIHMPFATLTAQYEGTGFCGMGCR